MLQAAAWRRDAGAVYQRRAAGTESLRWRSPTGAADDLSLPRHLHCRMRTSPVLAIANSSVPLVSLAPGRLTCAAAGARGQPYVLRGNSMLRQGNSSSSIARDAVLCMSCGCKLQRTMVNPTHSDLGSFCHGSPLQHCHKRDALPQAQQRAAAGLRHQEGFGMQLPAGPPLRRGHSVIRQRQLHRNRGLATRQGPPLPAH